MGDGPCVMIPPGSCTHRLHCTGVECTPTWAPGQSGVSKASPCWTSQEDRQTDMHTQREKERRGLSAAEPMKGP